MKFRRSGASVAPAMKIPYGLSDFAGLRRGGMFYADKTPFLRELESAEAGYRFLIFLRPRRIGKSLLVSMLEHYYDQAFGERFDDLFRGLWVHEHPTPERGSYLALSLDFSPVITSGDAEVMRRSFTTTVKGGVRTFLMRYRSRFPDLAQLLASLDSHDDAAGLMTTLLSIVAGMGQQMYLIIDEYDHFANRLLASGQEGLYELLVREAGFVRSFYAALKAGTRTGGLGRMFVTGVSPILLDDLSSGFNIIRHISMVDRFNAMAGFTRADVERAVDAFLAARPALLEDPRLGDRAQLLATLESYYDGYRFCTRAAESVFNSDLILYFLSEVESTGRYPEQMLDINVRTDYGRLQRIASLSGGAGSAIRGLLETILTEEHISSDLVEQFGMRAMYGRAQLVSLFYYMGMLTFGPGAADKAQPEMVIPNRVIRTLQWEYMAYVLQDQQRLVLDMSDVEDALVAMAARGDVTPLVELFRDKVMARIGVKDQRQFNEGTLKLMLLAYLSNSHIFHILSEKEFARGYCDLFLTPAQDLATLRYAWMLEVKYLKTAAKTADIEKVVQAAYAQLERYSSDAALVALLTRGRELKAGALIFADAKDVVFYPWPPVPSKVKATVRGAGKGLHKSVSRRGRA
jgi:hypothetical protein